MKNLERKSIIFKALGEPVRLKIVNILLKKDGCTCICELSKLLKKDQSVIFRHVGILKNAGVVDTCKESRFLMCSIEKKEKIKKIMEV